MSTTNELIELQALRGISPRQNRRLTLQAIAESTLYEEADLYPWDQSKDALGKPRPARQRRPLVQAGLGEEACRGMMDQLVSERLFPSIERKGATDDDGGLGLAEELKRYGIKEALQRFAEGLLVGSGVMGFHRIQMTPVGGSPREQFEDAGLDATWCTPVFVSQRRGEAAQVYAEHLAEIDEGLVEREETEDGPIWVLKEPAAGESLDLCFLRHEWPVAHEVPRNGGTATVDRTTWYRVDYLPDAIVHYRPRTLSSSGDKPPHVEVDHIEWTNWGIVPAVWGVPRGTAPGDIDGPPFLSPAARSLAQEADYNESFTQVAANYGASPQAVFQDCKPAGLNDAALANPEVTQLVMAATPDAAIMAESTDASEQGGKVHLLETAGKPVEVGHAQAKHLAHRLGQVTGMVTFDQAEAAGTVSGVALKLILQPKLDRVDGYRATLTKALFLLVAKMGAVARWGEVEVDVSWPETIEPTAPDLQALGRSYVEMVQGGIFPRDAATRAVAAFLGRDDADELADAVVKEEEERMKQAMDMAKAERDPSGGGNGGDGGE